MSATKAPGRPTKRDKAVAQDAIAEVDQSVENEDQLTVEFAHKLKGKTVPELRIMRAEALADESEAKRFLVLLRQRAANMPTTAEVEVEHEIIAAKQAQAKAEAWLKAVEKELENEFLDIYGSKK